MLRRDDALAGSREYKLDARSKIKIMKCFYDRDSKQQQNQFYLKPWSPRVA